MRERSLPVDGLLVAWCPICPSQVDDEHEEHGEAPPAEDDDEQNDIPIEPVEIPGVDEEPGEPAGVVGLNNPPAAVSDGEDSEDEEADTTVEVETDMNQRYGEGQHGHALRPRRPRDYSHLHANLDEHAVMTQYGVRKGLKVFWEAGTDSIVTEMQQLHDRDVTQPKAAHIMLLSKEEKQKSLQYLKFLKQKRCGGRIKARGCADGRKQRVYKSKEENERTNRGSGIPFPFMCHRRQGEKKRHHL